MDRLQSLGDNDIITSNISSKKIAMRGSYDYTGIDDN